jgi:glutamate synthase (NADPH/NADH) small chain
MEREGVLFRTNVEVGRDLPLERLLDDYELVVLAVGAEQPRDLKVPGRDLPGIHFAMEYLSQQNRRVAGDREEVAAPSGTISASGKHVVVIGGGDTGSDCIGTANRQGAASVTQLEIMPQPPLRENKALTWPAWPLRLRTSTSQEEGCARDFSVLTTDFLGSDRVERLRCKRVRWDAGRLMEVEGSTFEIKADLVLLGMGFTGASFPIEEAGLSGEGGVIAADAVGFTTSRPRVFACGDARRGQSLVVWAIREGRDCAAAVHEALSQA